MIVGVGDIITISRSDVQTYYKMIGKHLDAGGEFIAVLRDGTPDPHMLEISVITHEELTNPSGYSVSHYIPY